MAEKRYLGKNVLQAARERISFIFDRFPKVYVSFSGGKDYSVMLHLVAGEARLRKRKFGLLFIDLEAQYKITIEHVQEMFSLYGNYVEPFWVSLPLHLRNAVSQFQPHWVCWDPSEKERWVRTPPEIAITDTVQFPFFRHAMEFEEFVEDFGHWYGGDQLTACFVGIRTAESLNRWRTIARENKTYFEDKRYTTWLSGSVFNVYPVYDWKTEDIWTFNAKSGMPYNRLYDLMYKAGLSIHQQRICQPYGDDQRKGLWLFQIIEPGTWGKVVARVNGANTGAIYVRESGNIMGNIKITKPEGHTWQSFAMLLLDSMPSKTREHFEDKVAVFLNWYSSRGYSRGIPDEAEINDEAARKVPSWRRICKALLRNDYWCKGLSFSQHKSEAYEKYRKIMKKRRQRWGIMW